jgi:hypothetical protein
VRRFAALQRARTDATSRRMTIEQDRIVPPLGTFDLTAAEDGELLPDRAL